MSTIATHRSPDTKLVVLFLAASSLPLGACNKPKQYEATVEVTRIGIVRKDETGAPTSTDVEFSYLDCPGTQTEVVRGGKEFSACVQGKLALGQRVKVKVEHRWDPEGHYTYDVHEIHGCPRPPDPNDEASFKTIRECSDWTVNGAPVGFQCDYENKKELNKKCPWFKKR